MTDDPAAAIPDGSSRRSALGRWLGATGIFLHCTVIAFLYVASGLVMPLYGLAALFVIWVALLLFGIRWLRGPHPSLALGIPFLAAGAWLGVLIFGSNVLGWSP